MQQAVRVEVVPHATSADEVRYAARVNGAEFPVQAFNIEPDEQGRMFVSLVVEASSVQVGEPSEAQPQVPAVEAKQPRVSTWGDPSVPDPRADLPGWKPDPGKVEVHFTPGDGDRLIGGLRQAVRARMGRGDNGAAGVPA